MVRTDFCTIRTAMRWIFAGGAQETENSGAGFVQMHLCAGEIWGINASHPAWGEWIEILAILSNMLLFLSLTPHGVSGLK